MLGSAIERKPKVEQVNLTGGRLIREAKVCSKKHIKPGLCFFLEVDMSGKLHFWVTLVQAEVSKPGKL